MDESRSIHLNLDNAWTGIDTGLSIRDALAWGPRLRFTARSGEIESFYAEIIRTLPPFVLYGSGDFHHLTALLLRRIERPFILVSLDNHPDWDIRPPRWCCGGWINRALEWPHLWRAEVWGCGNFECWWPMRIFGNRRAVRAGRLAVHPWADDRPAAARADPANITREDWRNKFSAFADALSGESLYLTIDMDCLRAADAATNWESGRFELDDVRWIIGELRRRATIIGGDLCGAASDPVYARAKQRFAARIDHPKLPPVTAEERQAKNRLVFESLWSALAG